MIAITTGAPKIDVTVEMFNSEGANAVRAIRSQNMQKTPPPRKHAGITTRGFEEFSARFIRCGTAMPTNEMGPANAVTVADNTLEIRMSAVRNNLTFTPMLRA